MRASETTRRGRQRRRALIGAAFLVLALGAAACGEEAAAPPPPPPPNCPAAPPDAITSTILNQTNADRANAGLGGLSWNPQLACLAREWTNTMVGGAGLTHRDLGSTIRSPGYEGYASLAENILVGPGTMDGLAMQAARMNSPGHYRNNVGNYDSIGIAVASGPDGRLWATENFGRRF